MTKPGKEIETTEQLLADPRNYQQKGGTKYG